MKNSEHGLPEQLFTAARDAGLFPWNASDQELLKRALGVTDAEAAGHETLFAIMDPFWSAASVLDAPLRMVSKARETPPVKESEAFSSGDVSISVSRSARGTLVLIAERSDIGPISGASVVLERVPAGGRAVLILAGITDDDGRLILGAAETIATE